MVYILVIYNKSKWILKFYMYALVEDKMMAFSSFKYKYNSEWKSCIILWSVTLYSVTGYIYLQIH